jgi:hypothetical protein
VRENAGYGAITTLVVDWCEQTTRQAAVLLPKEKKRWPKALIIFKKALDYALASSGKKIHPFVDGPEVLAVERDTVRREFLKVYPADNIKAKGEAFRRCEKDAVSASLMTAREIETTEGGATFFWSASFEMNRSI